MASRMGIFAMKSPVKRGNRSIQDFVPDLSKDVSTLNSDVTGSARRHRPPDGWDEIPGCLSGRAMQSLLCPLEFRHEVIGDARPDSIVYTPGCWTRHTLEEDSAKAKFRRKYTWKAD